MVSGISSCIAKFYECSWLNVSIYDDVTFALKGYFSITEVVRVLSDQSVNIGLLVRVVLWSVVLW